MTLKAADLLLGRVKVARQAGPIVDEDTGLQLADHAGEVFRIPHFRNEHVSPCEGVKPEDVHLAIFGAELADRLVLILDIALVLFALPMERVVVGMDPVALRVVDAELHPRHMTGLGDFL